MTGSRIETVRLDQALHGYSDGHRLLASSAEFGADAARLLRKLSDASGPGSPPNFDGYLTAYPLPDSRYFVFARTWFARELDRPGCVWTHTLLIPVSGLLLSNIWHQINSRFVRPKHPLNIREYSAFHEIRGESLETTSRTWSEAFSGVFDSDRPIVVPLNSAKSLEDVVVDLTFQAWRCARIPLTCCCGSIRSRWYGDQPFDFQVVPEQSLRDVRRDLPESVVVDASVPHAGVGTQLQSVDGSRISAIALASHPARRRTRSFIGQAARVAAALSRVEAQGASVDDLIVTLLSLPDFVSNEHGIVEALVGAPARRQFLQSVSDQQILAAFLQVGTPQIPELDLQLAMRFHSLWNANILAAAELLNKAIDCPRSAAADVFWDRSVAIVAVGDVRSISRAFPVVAATLVRRTPVLQADPELWIVLGALSIEVVDAILLEDGELSTDALRAVLLSRIDGTAARIVATGKIQVVNLACATAAGDPHRPLAEDWEAVLAQNGSACAKWLADHSEVTSAGAYRIIRSVHPTDPALTRIAIARWREWLVEDAARVVHTGLASFVLSRFWNDSDETIDSLVAHAFMILHSASAESRLTQDDSRRVSTVIADFTRYWDQCWRLRGAYVSRFAKDGRSMTAFLKGLSQPTVLESVLRTWGWGQNEYAWLQRVVAAVVGNEIQVSDEQRHVIDSYQNWY